MVWFWNSKKEELPKDIVDKEEERIEKEILELKKYIVLKSKFGYRFNDIRTNKKFPGSIFEFEEYVVRISIDNKLTTCLSLISGSKRREFIAENVKFHYVINNIKKLSKFDPPLNPYAYSIYKFEDVCDNILIYSMSKEIYNAVDCKFEEYKNRLFSIGY